MTAQSLTAYAAFVVAGAATTMLGPLLPGLQERWGLDDASSGLLFAAQFGASTAAAACAGWLAARAGAFALIASGLALVAAGSAALSQAGWPGALALAGVYGLGLGLLIPAGNLAVAAMHPAASAGPIALLNLAFCAGAVLAPLAIAASADRFLAGLAGVSALLAAAAAPAARSRPAAAQPADGAPAGAATAIAAAMLFLYVGAEGTVSGWLPVRAVRGWGGHPLWTALPSLFWAAMLAGRSLTPLLLARRVTPHALLQASLIASLPAAVCFAWTSRAEWLIAGGGLAGLTFAPIFPLTVARYLDAVRDSRAAGLIFSFGGLGGATMPALAGYIAAESGDIRLAVSVVALSIGAILWLYFRLCRVVSPQSS